MWERFTGFGPEGKVMRWLASFIQYLVQYLVFLQLGDVKWLLSSLTLLKPQWSQAGSTQFVATLVIISTLADYYLSLKAIPRIHWVLASRTQGITCPRKENFNSANPYISTQWVFLQRKGHSVVWLIQFKIQLSTQQNTLNSYHVAKTSLCDFI